MTRSLRVTSTAPEVVYYALGGGFGHATRSLVLAQAAGVPFRMLLPRRLHGWTEDAVYAPPECESDPQALRQWVGRQCSGARLLVVDVFPRGLLGELQTLPLPAFLVTRWIKPAYALRPEVLSALRGYAAVWECERTEWPVGLPLGPVVRTPPEEALPCECVWLPSGPQELRDQQRERLTEAGLSVVTPNRFEVLSRLAGADLVVSAGGYNSYAEIVQAGTPAIFWPQPRLYDEQERRVRGRLGLQCRAWHRVVHCAEEFRQALQEWKKARPARCATLPLARLEPFQRCVQQAVFETHHVTAPAGAL